MDTPELVYDEDSRRVLVKSGDSSAELYTGVSPNEFELIDEVDKFVAEVSSLIDELFEATIHQQSLAQRRSYFDKLGNLQEKAGGYYRRCVDYQSELSEVESEVVTAQLEQLYKLNKFLKHYFRSLTIAQSLAFSQRLLTHYVETEHHLYLYGFVRNVCSTVEYLGNLMESRMGEGKIDLDDKNVNAARVYEEVRAQDLDEVFSPEKTLQIPNTNQQVKRGDLAISTGSMDYLWDKRCDIVHECPLVIPEENVEHLPDEIVSSNVLTTSDVKKLYRLSFRVHFHSVSMFVNFAVSYLQKQMVAMVEAWYSQKNRSSES